MKALKWQAVGTLLLAVAGVRGQSLLWWDRNVVKIDGGDKGAGVIFAVEDKQVLILTAFHVIAQKDLKNLLPSVSVTFWNDRFNPPVTVVLDPRVVKLRTELDAAIFPVPKPDAAVLQGLRRLSVRTVADGDVGRPVSVVGFAGEDWQPNAGNNTVTSISENYTDLDTSAGLAFGKSAIEGGFSGSPVMAADDSVVGILNSTGTNYAYATKIETILQAFSGLVPNQDQVFLTRYPNKQELPAQPQKGNLVLTGCIAGTRAIVNDRGWSESAGRITVQDLDPGDYRVRIVKPNFKDKDLKHVFVTAQKTAEADCQLDPELVATWNVESKTVPPSMLRACRRGSPAGIAQLKKNFEGKLYLSLGRSCDDLDFNITKQQGLLLQGRIATRRGPVSPPVTLAYLVLTLNSNGDELSGTITEDSTAQTSSVTFKRAAPDKK